MISDCACAERNIFCKINAFPLLNLLNYVYNAPNVEIS